MSRCPIVKPDYQRLPISQGDFLDVKKQLNTGEYREMIAGQYKESTDPERNVVVDLRRIGLCRVMAYLTGWSFVDLEGKPLPVSETALKLFDMGTWHEILTAIDEHHAATEQAQEDLKNASGGETASSAISTSAA